MSRLTQGLTAQRFAGKPLRQPTYSMREVPHCNKTLAGSTIGEVTNRDHFNDAMGEMVLLCNEVMRRKALRENANESVASASTSGRSSASKRKKDTEKKKANSKPLSLEYLADRCDVDDPIWGFIVRTDEITAKAGEKRKKPMNETQKGMIQGFITVTTFTNWQKSFRWDSMHDSAFSYDEPDVAEAMASKERKYDEDGSLAAEIQNTVRCGDPWNEGIVWPRVAEISLLGALGCGKVLLSLVIERLEAMQASGKHNYDYVVLQATSNSIPFYESMGFVRVGAVTEKNRQENEIKPNDNSNGIISGPIQKIKTKEKQPLRKFCKKLGVDVWDVIFLNKDIFPGIAPKSVLQKDTELFVPDVSKLDGSSNADTNGGKTGNDSVTQWYDAKDNETPREIAKKFNVCLKQLLAANRGRIQGLQGNSKLVENTRIQVSNLDVHYDEHVPYCHWTFPDDKFENNEPSYMMARKLNRKSRQEAQNKPVENSLAVSITKYEPPQDVKILEAQKNVLNQSPMKTPKKSKKRKLHPDQPVPPKRPKSAYFFFLDAEREKIKSTDQKLNTKEFFREASAIWKELKDRTLYNKLREQAVIEYEKSMKQYNIKMDKFKEDHPDWDEKATQEPPTSKSKKAKHLYNKVVKLTEDGRREFGTEFQYYYVLTYIPDLFWCHLAPMRSKGTFGTRWPKVKGRTRWVLVGEGEGKEVDISAAVCEVVKSRCMKRCDDADKEEWDITDPEFERSLSTVTVSSASAISISSASAKENNSISSEESDNELDTPKTALIKTDTMYSRLLRQK